MSVEGYINKFLSTSEESIWDYFCDGMTASWKMYEKGL